jgi:hypothetical protein
MGLQERRTGPLERDDVRFSGALDACGLAIDRLQVIHVVSSRP